MKILLATDGSECSEEAARFLTRFNFTPNDEIIVLHVISQIPYEDDYHAQVRQAIKRVAPKILKSTADALKSVNAKIVLMEQEGYPDSTIIDFASCSDIDMIVMGARGVKGIKMLFLGSSTRAVAIHAPKPVLVVKHHDLQISGKIKVLFCTDGSKTAEGVGKFIASLPLPEDSEIIVAHFSWSAVSDIPEKFRLEIDERAIKEVAKVRAVESARADRIIEEARSFFTDKFSIVKGLSRSGDPSQEILASEAELHPDIIAVGCRGLRGIKGMMGSVSRRILGHSSATVLIGRVCS